MVVVVLNQRISLVTPVPIAQDPVEKQSCTILHVVLKANEVIENSTCKHLIDPCFGWPFKVFSAVRVMTNQIRSPDSWIATDCPHPLSHSFVKNTVQSLQLDDHLVRVPKLQEDDKALRNRNSTAKFERPLSCVDNPSL
jgi:hypothetical protein